MPRSGWRAISSTGTASSSAAIAKSRMRSIVSFLWKYHASIIGSASFIISEGWKRVTPTCSQRRAPFTTSPASATAISSAIPSA